MIEQKGVYWDSSCFICFLNRREASRRHACEDVLRHAQMGAIELWTSTWTIVEVIRPKRHGAAPLPAWVDKVIESVPEAQGELERLWTRYQSSDPAIKLTAAQILEIQKMFEWPFIQKINLDERIAKKAVELARDLGLKPADSVHAASAILNKRISALQRWDRDFDKVKHLIAVEEPHQISAQHTISDFTRIGPAPEDFEDAKEQHNQLEAHPAHPSTIQGNNPGRVESETTREVAKKTKPAEKGGLGESSR
jgi:predicted nucleic acid-binding protein